MASFYYYDRNPSGYCFLVQITAFVNETSLGLPNLKMKGKTKWILVLVVKRRHRANGPLEPFSGRESQDIYCWLEKFKNQFKSRGRKLDSACLAFSWACNLTGLAKTFYFSLEPETRNIEFIDTTCRRLGVSQVDQFYYFVNGGMQTLNAKFWWVKRKIISQQLI